VLLTVARHITVQLEIAAVWFQLRAECADVAGGAGLSGLHRKCRHCPGRCCSEPKSGAKADQQRNAATAQRSPQGPSVVRYLI